MPPPEDMIGKVAEIVVGEEFRRGASSTEIPRLLGARTKPHSRRGSGRRQQELCGVADGNTEPLELQVKARGMAPLPESQCDGPGDGIYGPRGEERIWYEAEQESVARLEGFASAFERVSGCY